MDKNVLLSHGKLSLRPYTMADVQSLYEAARESIPEMTPWMPWCHANYSIEESRSWLSMRAQMWGSAESYDFAIVDARDGSYLGGCGLNEINAYEKMANLGYWVRTSRTKRGVATAAGTDPLGQQVGNVLEVLL